MTEPDYELLARFLKEYEQAEDRPAVLRRWSQDFPRLASDLAADGARDFRVGFGERTLHRRESRGGHEAKLYYAP